MITNVVFINPTTIQVDLVDDRLPPLPGPEKACVALARSLASFPNYRVHVVGNVTPGQWSGVTLHAMHDLPHVLTDCGRGVAVWVRAYGGWRDLRDHHPRFRHILWSGDSVKDLAALGARREIKGTVDDPSHLLAGYDMVVLVSKWHLADWRSAGLCALPTRSIYNYTLDIQDRERTVRRWPDLVVGTSHPRKSLAFFCQAARTAKLLGWGLRFTTTSSPALYADELGSRVYLPVPNGGLRDIGSFAEVRARFADVVDFRDPMASDDLADLLLSASVFLHPDFSIETGSMALIESVKAGCRPVVSSQGALPELAGDLGWIIPDEPGTPEFAVGMMRGLRWAWETGAAHELNALPAFTAAAILEAWRELLTTIQDKGSSSDIADLGYGQKRS